MKNNRTSSLSVGIKSASSEGGSEELGRQSTRGAGQGQGGEKGRPVNISFLSYFFFFWQDSSFLSSWVWSLWWVPVASQPAQWPQFEKVIDRAFDRGCCRTSLVITQSVGSLGRTRPSLWHRLSEGTHVQTKLATKSVCSALRKAETSYSFTPEVLEDLHPTGKNCLELQKEWK